MCLVGEPQCATGRQWRYWGHSLLHHVERYPYSTPLPDLFLVRAASTNDNDDMAGRQRRRLQSDTGSGQDISVICLSAEGEDVSTEILPINLETTQQNERAPGGGRTQENRNRAMIRILTIIA